VSSPHVSGGDRFIFKCNWFLKYYFTIKIWFSHTLRLGNGR
jgi:hypothetical protein